MRVPSPLCAALGVTFEPAFVLSAVGGGGKTSLLLRLGQEAAAAGHTVLYTTTTQIRQPGPAHMPTVTDGDLSRLRVLLDRDRIACVGIRAGDKLGTPASGTLAALRGMAHLLLVEADGAKCLPVKAPARHEPVLYPDSSLVVAVAGLRALGQPIGACCFRVPQALALLGVREDTQLTPSLLARLLVSDRGGCKGVSSATPFAVVLNQADDAVLTARGVQTADCIRGLRPHCRVVVTALRDPDCVKATRT
ncbi:MAG: putative selenium-dependent hydroxylase accessory protein YqeC [Clostridiales bacterium]|nr:putative selenium-dependent hydroxylase accessory protein YqeC [Clostridiales bacterium]